MVENFRTFDAMTDAPVACARPQNLSFMSRPRTPTDTLRARGAFDKNPQRARTDPPAQGPLGEPPPHFGPELQAVWIELRDSLPVGVATQADRAPFEDLVVLKYERRTAEKFSMAKQSALHWLYSHFGMTPSDRSKVHVSKPDGDEDPAAKYFGPVN